MKNKSICSKKQCTLVYQNSFTLSWKRQSNTDFLCMGEEVGGREAACWIYAGGNRVDTDSLLRKYTRLSVGTVQPQSLLQNCEIRT